MVISLTLPSELKIVPETTLGIIKKIKSKNINDDTLFNLRLALEEALVNAIKHGNKQNKERKVIVKIAVSLNKITMEIKDEGQGFNHNKLSSPIEAKNLKKPYGRGVFLIKKLMDKVEFFDGGSRIKMVKSLTRRKEGQ